MARDDFGNISIAESLRDFKPLRGVYGNIDGRYTRRLPGAKHFYH